jgi:hypothetical protein
VNQQNIRGMTNGEYIFGKDVGGNPIINPVWAQEDTADGMIPNLLLFHHHCSF